MYIDNQYNFNLNEYEDINFYRDTAIIVPDEEIIDFLFADKNREYSANELALRVTDSIKSIIIFPKQTIIGRLKLSKKIANKTKNIILMFDYTLLDIEDTKKKINKNEMGKYYDRYDKYFLVNRNKLDFIYKATNLLRCPNRMKITLFKK